MSLGIPGIPSLRGAWLMGGMRGCHAGARRLLHELIDSIHSWDEESDEQAMVNMLASFPQERFEVGYAAVLQRP